MMQRYLHSICGILNFFLKSCRNMQMAVVFRQEIASNCKIFGLKRKKQRQCPDIYTSQNHQASQPFKNLTRKKKTATGITATFTRENRSSPITSTPITSFGYNKINFPGRDIKKRTTRIDSVTKRNSIYWIVKVDFCIVCITCKVNKTQRESILSVYILL